MAQGTVAQSRIFGGAIGIAVSIIITNSHLESTLERVASPSLLKALFISLFTILQYELETGVLFRESYIKAFAEDLRAMCVLGRLLWCHFALGKDILQLSRKEVSC